MRQSQNHRAARFLPLLHEMEERAGERRRVLIGNSPLLDPLPARSSRGEEETKSAFCRRLHHPRNDRPRVGQQPLQSFNPHDPRSIDLEIPGTSALKTPILPCAQKPRVRSSTSGLPLRTSGFPLATWQPGISHAQVPTGCRSAHESLHPLWHSAS